MKNRWTYIWAKGTPEDSPLGIFAFVFIPLTIGYLFFHLGIPIIAAMTEWFNELTYTVIPAWEYRNLNALEIIFAFIPMLIMALVALATALVASVGPPFFVGWVLIYKKLGGLIYRWAKRKVLREFEQIFGFRPDSKDLSNYTLHYNHLNKAREKVIELALRVHNASQDVSKKELRSRKNKFRQAVWVANTIFNPRPLLPDKIRVWREFSEIKNK